MPDGPADGPTRSVWRLRAPAVVAAFGVLAAAGCGGSRGPDVNILMVSSRDGDYAIYAMTADGGDQHRLTDERGDPSTPGGLDFQLDPAWSPDGTEIAFASARAGSLDIYVMQADGSGTERLTTTRAGDRHPTWSADGAKIAFERDADGGHIWVMNANGSDVARLTDDLASETEPAWSPDGARIAYSRRAPGTAVREIWLVGVDGSGRRPLTAVGADAINPAWSPDGSIVAFAANPGGARYGIFTINENGQGIRRVVAGPDDAFEPAFSPDGQMLAYFAGGSVFVEGAEGDDVELTNPADNSSSPAWKPAPLP